MPARIAGCGRTNLKGVSFSQIGTVDAATTALAGQGYLADRSLALAITLAVTLEQPLLLEGEAGVGKTEVARAIAAASGAPLVRLQCHEGIDLHHAVYDWDYARQLLALRAAEGGVDEGELFSRRFLLRDAVWRHRFGRWCLQTTGVPNNWRPAASSLSALLPLESSSPTRFNAPDGRSRWLSVVTRACPDGIADATSSGGWIGSVC